MKKMGRPTQNPRKNSMGVRVSDVDLAIMEAYCEKMGVNRTEAISRAIKILGEKIMYFRQLDINELLKLDGKTITEKELDELSENKYVTWWEVEENQELLETKKVCLTVQEDEVTDEIYSVHLMCQFEN